MRRQGGSDAGAPAGIAQCDAPGVDALIRTLTKAVLWRAGKSFVRLVGKLGTEVSETAISEVSPSRRGNLKRKRYPPLY